VAALTVPTQPSYQASPDRIAALNVPVHPSYQAAERPGWVALTVPDGVKAAAEIESSTPFDQRVFDVLNSKVASEPSVEDAVDLLVLKTAAVTAHRNSQ
jgi:hypothetical protein